MSDVDLVWMVADLVWDLLTDSLSFADLVWLLSADSLSVTNLVWMVADLVWVLRTDSVSFTDLVWLLLADFLSGVDLLWLPSDLLWLLGDLYKATGDQVSPIAGFKLRKANFFYRIQSTIIRARVYSS